MSSSDSTAVTPGPVLASRSYDDVEAETCQAALWWMHRPQLAGNIQKQSRHGSLACVARLAIF